MSPGKGNGSRKQRHVSNQLELIINPIMKTNVPVGVECNSELGCTNLKVSIKP
jgi:hypothetical protein